VRERWESLSALVSLADELGEALDHSLPNFISELDTRADLQHAPVADGVTLSSVHSAKGLEWPVVFVVGCSEGLIPLQYAETPEQIEEERRLLYVAITRAADRLVLSWAHSRNPGGRASRERSRFLDRLGLRTGTDAPQIHRGGAKAREERRRTGPARCRVCRKGLVSAEERTLGRCRSCPSNLNEPLLDALRAWRLQESRDAEVPAYVVFTDRTLLAIAEQQPGDIDALADIPGVGPAKLERYAQSVLRMVEDNQRDGAV
jgi:DNA helicase-2/ATP-dependent DNA helicase PcrA